MPGLGESETGRVARFRHQARAPAKHCLNHLDRFADQLPKDNLILSVIPAKAGIQRPHAIQHKTTGFLLPQE